MTFLCVCTDNSLDEILAAAFENIVSRVKSACQLTWWTCLHFVERVCEGLSGGFMTGEAPNARHIAVLC